MTKPREKTREELQAEIEDGKKKIRQLENREKMLRQKLSKEERRTRSHRLIVRGAVFESIVPEAKNMTDEEATALLRLALTSEPARETAPEQPPQSPNLANLLMKYLSVQREKSRKYSQRWQQQHAAEELKTIAAAVNYLSEHGISNLDELDASLSSVSDKAYSIREGMKAAEQRMKELQKLIEYTSPFTMN